MTWTVTKEVIDSDNVDPTKPGIGPMLNVRAIINLGHTVDGQNELKDLIASLGKHVKMEPPVT